MLAACDNLGVTGSSCFRQVGLCSGVGNPFLGFTTPKVFGLVFNGFQVELKSHDLGDCTNIAL